MKSPVAVTLIIVGGLLIFGPVIADHSARAQVVAIMTEQKLTSVNLTPPPMSPQYRFGCWFVGSLMITVAVLSSHSRRTEPKAE
ncbi:hypothetical protein ACXR0O_25390 [Verrucomicrobiota bacterium sgz303538]